MKIRISDIIDDSIVDGKGIRFTIFTQGCFHNCKECHNPSTHDINGGREGDTKKICELIKQNPLLDGITLSGGEPFLQVEPCIELANTAHEIGLDVWAYTGFTYEDLLLDNNKKLLLENVDVLVDGKFDHNKKSLDLDFRGSSNQRIIDVRKSLKSNIAVEYTA